MPDVHGSYDLRFGRIVLVSEPELEPVRARKECSRCRRLLPMEAFSKNASCQDGHGHRCKECDRQTYAARKEAAHFEAGDTERETTGSVCWSRRGRTGRTRSDSGENR